MSDKERGLYQKFNVERVDGTHKDCNYFVLDLDHDPIARIALQLYAVESFERGYVELARDLMKKLANTKEAHNQYIANKEKK